jgi:ferredoxin
MADKLLRNPENAPGKWYIDDTCAPCHTCMDIAGPNTATPLLRYNADETKSFFAVQPSGPEQENAAQEALEVCPTQAIGNDG